MQVKNLSEITEAWQLLCNQNFRILPLKSYELAANGEKAPRNAEVGQQTLTLASSACSYNEEAPESARLKIQVSETGLAVKTRSAHSQVQILPSAPPKSLKHKYALARNRYKPPKINVLLIAESPPTSGGYFYSERAIGKDHLFRETMKALEFWPRNRPMRKGCDKRPMLERFRSAGFFLIDTCELPIDNLKPRHRRISTIQGALTLPHRVRELDPHRILIVKKTVFEPAAQALSDAGFGDKILNARPLPFPSHGNQSKFRTMMIRLLNRTENEGG